MDWFKRQFSGKPYIKWDNLWFPVDFPLSQSIDICSTERAMTGIHHSSEFPMIVGCMPGAELPVVVNNVAMVKLGVPMDGNSPDEFTILHPPKLR